MDIRPIRNDQDHRAALAEIERLWNYPENTPENDKLDVLTTLVEAYEEKRWPRDAVTPLDILRTAITDDGRSQKELADLLGSRSQASDLLNGKRRISLDVARKISTAWHIPIQLLVAPYEVNGKSRRRAA